MIFVRNGIVVVVVIVAAAVIIVVNYTTTIVHVHAGLLVDNDGCQFVFLGHSYAALLFGDWCGIGNLGRYFG